MAFKTPCLARFLGPILFCLLLSTTTLAAGPAPADPFSAPPFDGAGGTPPLAPPDLHVWPPQAWPSIPVMIFSRRRACKVTVPSKKGPSRTAGSYFKGGFSVNDSHPDVHLRVNGIMGANGDIREALGCGSVKGSFVECTLEGAKVVKE